MLCALGLPRPPADERLCATQGNGSTGPVRAQEGAAGASVSLLQVGQCMEKKCVWREHLRSGFLFQGVDASLRYPRPLAPCLVVYHAQGREIDSRKPVYFLWLFLQRGRVGVRAQD